MLEKVQVSALDMEGFPLENRTKCENATFAYVLHLRFERLQRMRLEFDSSLQLLFKHRTLI